MIESSHIKQMVEHILRRQRGVVEREAVDPSREWLVGVAVTVGLVIVGGLVSYGLYLGTISLEVNTEHIPAVAIPYNAATVDSVVGAFHARIEAYNDIRGVTSNEFTGVSVPTTLIETVVQEPATTTAEAVPTAGNTAESISSEAKNPSGDILVVPE